VPGGRHNKEQPRPEPGSEETSQPTGQGEALDKREESLIHPVRRAAVMANRNMISNHQASSSIDYFATS
jgi:hypothetical protein